MYIQICITLLISGEIVVLGWVNQYVNQPQVRVEQESAADRSRGSGLNLSLSAARFPPLRLRSGQALRTEREGRATRPPGQLTELECDKCFDAARRG
jgi:hypothetical protein